MTPTRSAQSSVREPSSGHRGAGDRGGDASYRVTVAKDYLVFSAGHFITYDSGGRCEALHGHNYRASVTLWGDVNEDAYVYDFVTLKNTMRELVDELDHRMLLPRDNPQLDLHRDGDGISVSYGERRYLFPESDVVVLPVPNTTAEMLARHLLDRLAERLRADGAGTLKEAEVEVEESFGQAGWARRSLGTED